MVFDREQPGTGCKSIVENYWKVMGRDGESERIASSYVLLEEQQNSQRRKNACAGRDRALANSASYPCPASPTPIYTNKLSIHFIARRHYRIGGLSWISKIALQRIGSASRHIRFRSFPSYSVSPANTFYNLHLPVTFNDFHFRLLCTIIFRITAEIFDSVPAS